jgi:Protein of unknown function (DUF2505)
VRVTADLRYDADPATVFDMLSDHAFQDRKLGQTGALSWEVQVQPQNGGAVIVSRRALPTDQVPDAFKAMVGAQITIAQTETWGAAAADGSRTGTMDLEVVGAPIRMQAKLSLSATAEGGSLERVDGELKARVPLIGGRIERAAEPAVRAAIDAEQRIGQAWLAER